MAAKFSLSDSLAERQKITTAQYREIERLYKDLARKAAKEAERLKSSTVSGKLQTVELKKLEKKLQEEADKIGARLESAIPAAMKKAATGVVSDAASFQGKLGISIEGAYRHVPTDIVETLVSGKLYKGKWSLSKSIWADISKTQSDISKVVAEGIALNKSSYDIAKDLEMYVDPSAKKPWDWSKVYPGTKKKIDYNAQRLARTMVGHAYQQSVVAVCKDDPFVDGIEWISGHSTTTCELCRDRNGKVFPAGKLPLDHPNGKCSFAPHVSKSLSQIGDDLADWVSGKPNKSLDNWFKSMRPNVPVAESKSEAVHDDHKIINGREDAIRTWKRRKDKFDFEIEDVIDYQGFNGLPRVVGAEDFERLTKRSKFIAQRTYSANSQEILDSYRDQLYKGKWYVDCSTGGAQYGQGMYCAADYEGILTDGIKAEMRHYQDLNGKRGNPLNYTETLTLDESAKIITYEELELMKSNYAMDLKGHFRGYVDGLDVSDETKILVRAKPKFSTEEQKQQADEIYASMSDEERKEKVKIVAEYVSNAINYANARSSEIRDMDMGSFAVLNGYDAINAEGHGKSGSYTVILNRTKLIIKKDE